MRIPILPDPALVVLVGPAGAGKSTFAARHFRPDEILSSDSYRAAIAGDEADQRVSGLAFRFLHADLSRRLTAGRFTVVDATNLRAPARRVLLGRAREAGLPAVAIVFDLPADVVHARNAGRRRVVDPAVVARHLDAMRIAIDRDRLVDEGFELVIVLRDPVEAERIGFERAPADAPADRRRGEPREGAL